MNRTASQSEPVVDRPGAGSADLPDETRNADKAARIAAALADLIAESRRSIDAPAP
jgi:hypothetical protein